MKTIRAQLKTLIKLQKSKFPATRVFIENCSEDYKKIDFLFSQGSFKLLYYIKQDGTIEQIII